MGISVYSVLHECEFPLWMSYATIFYMLSFLFLFGNFYMQSYIEKKRIPNVDVTTKAKGSKKISNNHDNDRLICKKLNAKQD